MDYFKYVAKKKKLQKLGSSLVIQIPKAWLETLDWNRTTPLGIEIHYFNKEIVIKEIEDEEARDTIEI